MTDNVLFLHSKASRLAASGALAQDLGIPDGEYTPCVRDAIATLTAELDDLRCELRQTRHHLEQVEQAADLDPLLPVLNRRAFVRAVARRIATIGRYATPTSLFYFDLDGFKSVNDTFGHAGGDAALGHFAGELLNNTRESDEIGRLGGDEFGVLLCHASLEQASLKADRLAEHLRVSPVTWNGLHIPIAFSHGVFELKSSESAEASLARADAQMYARKRIRGVSSQPNDASAQRRRPSDQIACDLDPL